MPRQGDGPTSDNAVEDTHDLIHGQGKDSTKIERNDKTAPMPAKEKGEAIEGMNASGGGAGVKRGEGVGQGGSGSTN